MALSDYDTLMVNEKGESLQGYWTAPSGVVVEIYKTMLHIHDRQAWDKDSGWVEPIIMAINEGDLKYKDVEIRAKRGPQGGIYVVAYARQYTKKEPKDQFTACIGCGVSGWSSNRYTGVTKASLKWFMKELTRKEWQESVCSSSIYDEKTKRYRNTKEILRDKSYVNDYPDEIRNIDLLKANRYCQGDAYIYNNLSNIERRLLNIPKPTLVGDAKDPIFISAIKKFKAGGKK